METDQKNRLQLIMIFGSICLSLAYINNPIINGTSFRGAIYRFLPFLADYNPVTISLIFIIICFTIAFLLSDKSIPTKQDHNVDSSKPKPIVQDVIIRTTVIEPEHTSSNSSGPVIEPQHEDEEQKKPIIYDFYDKKNRKRFHW